VYAIPINPIKRGYRTNDGVKVMNGDKIRKLFVKQSRKLLRDNGDFEEEFIGKFRSISQKIKN
jgi:hypothetical protein